MRYERQKKPSNWHGGSDLGIPTTTTGAHTGPQAHTMTATELKKWRERLGLSRNDAADSLGISRQHYHKLETGRVKILRVYHLATAQVEYLHTLLK